LQPLVIVIYKNDEWKDFVGLEKPSDLEETIEMSLSYDAKIPNNYLRITGWIGPTHLSVVKDIRFDDIVSELIMNVSLGVFDDLIQITYLEQPFGFSFNVGVEEDDSEMEFLDHQPEPKSSLFCYTKYKDNRGRESQHKLATKINFSLYTIA